MSRHEIEFSTRFASAIEQMANEGISLSLPIVVIEHIYNSDCSLSVVRSQARKCAKEGMPKKNEEDDYYFSLLKVKEVTQETEREVTRKKKSELMIVLRCKNKTANYAIYYDLNNKVEHKMRISVYVFDREGCMYPDKTASKTPLNIAVLNEMFKVNKSITRPEYVDNKPNRRVVARKEKKEKVNEEGYPKEIRMGEIQLPPYLWFTQNNSTPDPKGLAGENNVLPSTSRSNQHNSTPDLRQRGLAGETHEQAARNVQYSTPDPWQRGLAGEDSHTNINNLLQTNNSQDRRSILIDENSTDERRSIIDDHFYKSSVFDRLGSGKMNPTKINKESEEQQGLNNNNHDESNCIYQYSHQKSTPDLRQRGLAGESHKQYQESGYNREPERFGREEQRKEAHKRDTSRESRTSGRREQKLTSDFYHKWKIHNNKRQSKTEVNDPAKRPHVENNKHTPQTYAHQHNAPTDTNTNNSTPSNNKSKSSIVIGKTTKRAREDPPRDRRASFKEGVGRVLWLRQSAPKSASTSAHTQQNQQEPGTSRRTFGQKEGGMLQPQQKSSLLFSRLFSFKFIYFLLQFCKS